MADTGLGFASYHLPGQSAKQAKKAPDRAPDVAKLQADQSSKTGKLTRFSRFSSRFQEKSCFYGGKLFLF